MLKTQLELNISTDALREAINVYVMSNHGQGESPKYLVMNQRTCDMLKSSTLWDARLIRQEFHIFINIPIAICENLKDYQIDLVS